MKRLCRALHLLLFLLVSVSLTPPRLQAQTLIPIPVPAKAAELSLPFNSDAAPIAAPGLPAAEVPAISPAVARARVLSRMVHPGGGERGGALVIERIARPVLTLREQAEAEAADAATAAATAEAAANSARSAVPSKALAEWRAAVRTSSPRAMLLFTPRVTIFPPSGGGGGGERGGAGAPGTLSLVEWWSWSSDPERGYEPYAAWVQGDLSAIDSCPDLNSKDRTRYLLMPTVMSAGTGFSVKFKSPSLPLPPPAASEFAGPQSFLLEKGDATQAGALEPLHLLLAAFAKDGEKIAADHAALLAHQEASAALAAEEAAHPQPPANTVLRFWTSDADEIEPAGALKSGVVK